MFYREVFKLYWATLGTLGDTSKLSEGFGVRRVDSQGQMGKGKKRHAGGSASPSLLNPEKPTLTLQIFPQYFVGRKYFIEKKVP